MNNLLFHVLLPMGLTASLLYTAFWLLRPLTQKAGAALQRMSLLLVCLLFLLPLPLFAALVQTFATQQPAAAQTPPPLAAAYQAGQALGAATAPAPPQPQTPALAQNLPPANAPTFSLSFVQVVCLVYFSVLLGLLVFSFLRYVHLQLFLAKNTQPVTNQNLLQIYQNTANQLGLTRKPRLLLSSSLSTPLLAGVLHPKIILPHNTKCSQSTIFALQHELTHYKQRDIPCKLLVALAAILHWYNPLAHLLRLQFTLVCEENCDANVTKHFSSQQRFAYANALLGFASGSLPPALAGFASPAKQLKKRLQKLVCPATPTKRLRALCLACLSALLGACVLTGCAVATGALASQNTSALPAASASSSNISAPAATSAQSTPSALPIINGTHAFVNPVPSNTGMGSAFSVSHPGISFSSDTDTPVYASAVGHVLFAGPQQNLGNVVVLQHSNGLRTQYAFCGKLQVKQEDNIAQGQIIATTSDTPLFFAINATPDDTAPFTAGIAQNPSLLVSPLNAFGLLNNTQKNTLAEISAKGYIAPLVAKNSILITRQMGNGHRGIDFSTQAGTPVVAAAAGTVLTAETHYNYGKYVILQHEDGTKTLYAHCADLFVKPGATVLQGQTIASVGATGNTTGSNLHMEFMASDDTLLNPADYLVLDLIS